MYETYLSDAMAQYNRYENGRQISEELVQQRQREYIFQKYGTTKAEYDSSLVFYGRNLKTYNEICNNVEKRLKVEETRVINDTVRTIVPQSTTSITDSTNHDTTYRTLFEDSLYYGIARLSVDPVISHRFTHDGLIQLGDSLLIWQMQLYAYPPLDSAEYPSLAVRLHYYGDSITECRPTINSKNTGYIAIDSTLQLKAVQTRLQFNPKVLRNHFIYLKQIKVVADPIHHTQP